MTLPRNLAGIGGPRKIDQAKLRKAFGGVRVWISQAKVLNEQFEDDSGVDVLVRLIPAGVECFASMASGYAGADFGDVWRPAENDTVLCAMQQEEDGDVAAVFIIGALHSSARKKPAGASIGKRRMVIREGDDLEIETQGTGAAMALTSDDALNLTAKNNSSYDVGSANQLNLIGKIVAIHKGGSRFAVALINELNVVISAFNAAVTIFNGHQHTETGGTTSTPTTSQVSTSTATGSEVLETE